MADGAVPTASVSASRGLRVVAIGGGTGLSTLLKGLKQYVPTFGTASNQSFPVTFVHDWHIIHLSAVVTVSDDGGSSGRLRKDFNMLPPGDIRNCIVALSEDEALLSKLFQHRFVKGTSLEGHSFGNLFLAALTSITGDFSEAVRLSSEILATRGHIYPATNSNLELEAVMQDGSRVRGETNITASKERIEKLALVPADAEPLPETLEAISRADLITIGPGSLFTSLIPNLLVKGIVDAIVRSSAVKVYVCNLMTQANESIGRTAADHIKALNQHAQAKIFDYALLNSSPAPQDLLEKYAAEGCAQVAVDEDAIRELGVEPKLGDYLYQGTVARHATDRVAADLMTIASQAAQRRREQLFLAAR
jgi:uncharacterized cofD-like protein